MAFHGSWAAGLLLHGNPFEVGVFIPPWNAPGEQVVPVIGSETGFAVCETPNKAAAMRFLEFIAGKGFSILQGKRQNIPPFKQVAGAMVSDPKIVDYTNMVSRYPVTSQPLLFGFAVQFDRAAASFDAGCTVQEDHARTGGKSLDESVKNEAKMQYK